MSKFIKGRKLLIVLAASSLVLFAAAGFFIHSWYGSNFTVALGSLAVEVNAGSWFGHDDEKSDSNRQDDNAARAKRRKARAKRLAQEAKRKMRAASTKHRPRRMLRVQQ